MPTFKFPPKFKKTASDTAAAISSTMSTPLALKVSSALADLRWYPALAKDALTLASECSKELEKFAPGGAKQTVKLSAKKQREYRDLDVARIRLSALADMMLPGSSFPMTSATGRTEEFERWVADGGRLRFEGYGGGDLDLPRKASPSRRSDALAHAAYVAKVTGGDVATSAKKGARVVKASEAELTLAEINRITRAKRRAKR